MSNSLYFKVYLFIAYFLPSFSYATFLSLPPAQNYALVVPFVILFAISKIKIINFPIAIFIMLNIGYIVIASYLGEYQSLTLLLAYLLLSFNVLLIYNFSKLPEFKRVIYNFFKLFFYINLFYCVYQNIVISLGLGSIAMLHSNDLLQMTHGYVPPEFLWPFHRVTGLFNESSPFTFYLIAYSWFIYSQKSINYSLLSLIFLCILMGGSKLGILFISCFLIIVLFQVYSVILLGIYAVYLSYAVTSANGIIDTLFFGRAGSIYKRLSQTTDSLTESTDNSVVAFNYTTTSSGGLSLDLFSVIVNNFGYFYLICIIAFFMLTINAVKVSNTSKIMLLTILILGFISNGSLLIPQYSILLIFMFYFNSHFKNAHAKTL